MVHHRCTRCKEESLPRHKYKRSGVAGVYCSDCLRIVMGEGISTRKGIFGFFRDLWDMVKDWVTSFVPKPVVKESAIRVAYSVQEAKARDILPDARRMNPQKR